MTRNFESLGCRASWLGLIFVLVLTACSGNATQTNNDALNTTALEARQSPAAASAELPKAAEAVAAAMAYQPAQKDVVDMTGQMADAAQAPVSGALSASAGQAQAAVQAMSEPQPVAKVDVQVDLSLPQEPKVGSRAPDFTLQTLDGKTVTMAEMIGRPVVISYWATWCIPCKQELPILQRLNDQYAAQGLVVLTINAIDQDKLEDVQAQAGEMGLTNVLLDDNRIFAEAYQAAFFPSTYFVDPAGVIRAIKLGDSTEADLTGKIQSLLAGSL